MKNLAPFLIILLLGCNCMKNIKDSAAIIGDNNLLIYSPDKSTKYSNKEVTTSVQHHQKVVLLLEETIKYNNLMLFEMNKNPKENKKEIKKIEAKSKELEIRKLQAQEALELWKNQLNGHSFTYPANTLPTIYSSIDSITLLKSVYDSQEYKKLSGMLDKQNNHNKNLEYQISELNQKILSNKNSIKNTKEYFHYLLNWTGKIEALACSQSYTNLHVYNGCSEKIYASLHYLSLDDQWVTEGWWGIEPFNQKKIGIKPKSRYIYIRL